MTRKRFAVLAFPIVVLVAASGFVGLLVSATSATQSPAAAASLGELQLAVLTASGQGAVYGPSVIEDAPGGFGRWLYLDRAFDGAELSFAFTITNLGDTTINIKRGTILYDTLPPGRSVSFTSPFKPNDPWGYEGTGSGTVLRFAYVVRSHELF